MKTKREIILETAEFYHNNPHMRGYEENRRGPYMGKCFYVGHRGKRCAVGRCMRDDVALSPVYNSVGINALPGGVDYYLKGEYRGHQDSFWIALQNFHDSPAYWNNMGMTETGQAYLKDLLNTWCGESSQQAVIQKAYTAFLPITDRDPVSNSPEKQMFFEEALALVTTKEPEFTFKQPQHQVAEATW